MSFQAEGRLYKKFDANQITDTFKKREFVLEIPDGSYPQLVKFELIQNSCDALDPFNENDMVRVSFNLRGRSWTPPQGDTKFFNTLNAWRIETLNEGGATTTSAPASAADSSFPSANDEPTVAADDDLPF